MIKSNSSVSVIIPAFNIDEGLLSRCLESVCDQSFPNIEVIVVDDGSDEDHAKVMDKLSSHDQRIRVIHKENGGVSSARNKALSLAQGDYVFFLDSDDYLYTRNVLERAVDLLEAHSADIVFGQVVVEYPLSQIRERYAIEGPLVLSTKQEIEKLAQFFLSYGVPKSVPFPDNLRRGIAARLFRRELLAGLSFDESVSYGEDSLFDYRATEKAKRVVIADDPWYVYCQYQDSAIRTISFDEVISQAKELLILGARDCWLYAERISNLFIRACTKEARNNEDGAKAFNRALDEDVISQAFRYRRPECFQAPQWKSMLMGLAKGKHSRLLYLAIKVGCLVSDGLSPDAKRR